LNCLYNTPDCKSILFLSGLFSKRLMLEPEVQQIFTAIDARENFLLSGGAGSGKTYSLDQKCNY
jgi:Flp pilus assembly CpaF family ATPase